MKKFNILSAIFMMCLMTLGICTFSACNGEDDLDTNQFVAGPSLNVYGPSPVARGGELRFIGSSLNQVTEVIFPGGSSVKDIKVISEREIRVTVPQDAQPGIVTLVTPSKQLQTLTALSYTEPVGFDEEKPFEPAFIKPGNVLKINGEYLNLVTSVIFSDNVVVDQEAFETHTRKEISLVVPYQAKTGAVTLSFYATGDTIPNEIISTDMLGVALPTVNKVINIEGSKPGDVITITGEDFDLITMVLMPNDEYVNFEPIDEAWSGIRFTLPATISAGYIRVVTASGVKVIVAKNGVAEPSELAATPATELREGDLITITGKELDVVTNVTFPGVSEPVALEEGGSDTKISVKAPAGFTSGEMLLNTGFGASFPIAIETAKPQLTTYSPVPVSAGNDLTITGKNLDLVALVTFTDGLTVSTFTAQSAESLTLTVPVTAVTGVLGIKMANGEEVEFKELTVDSPVFCFIPEMPNTDELHAGELLTATVVNADKLTGVQIDGTDCQYILIGDVLYVGVPEKAGKTSKLHLISSNGEVTYDLSVIPNTEQTFVLWTGAADLAGWSWNWQIGDGTCGASNPKMFSDMGLQEGDHIRLWATNYNDWWQVQFFDGHWSGQTEIGTATGLNNGNNINSGIYDLAANGGYIDIPATATLVEQLTTLNDWGYCWILQGEGIIISKIDVIRHISLETTLWKGEADLAGWSWNWQIGDGSCGASNPQMFVEAGLKAGQTIRLYATNYNDWWQVQFFDGHWTGQTEIGTATGLNNGNNINSGIYDLAAHNGAIEIPVTETLATQLTTLNDWGYCWILQGEGVIITKITVE